MASQYLTAEEKLQNTKNQAEAQKTKDPGMPSQKPGEAYEDFKARTQAYIKKRDAAKPKDGPPSLGDLAKKKAQEDAIKEKK